MPTVHTSQSAVPSPQFKLSAFLAQAPAHSPQSIVHLQLTICRMADAGQETTTSSEFEVVGDAEQVAQATDQAQPQPAEQPLQISEASLARTRLEESVLSHGVRIAPGILRLRSEDVLNHLTWSGL